MRIRVKQEWKERISQPKQLAAIMQAILAREDAFDQEKEHIWSIGFNGGNVIKYIDLVHLGTGNMCVGFARDIFRMAVAKGAIAMILVHNHPSGDATPSKDDIALTDKIKQAGEILGIKLLDHLIISANDYTAFSEMNLL
jgi:DNA repair protein RadC